MFLKAAVPFLFAVLAIPTASMAQTAFPPSLPAMSKPTSRSSSNSPVETWRAQFRHSKERGGLGMFLDTMQEATVLMEEEPTMMAFLATAEILTAGRRFNPISKWKGFTKWTAVLDRQVQKKPNDPDIRFLRMTVQANAPGFLGYAESLPEDCLAVRTSLDGRYWDDDPAHHEFVKRIVHDTKACI